jgi:hypothetical protein
MTEIRSMVYGINALVGVLQKIEKEVRKMKKTYVMLAVLVLAAAFFCLSAEAAADKTVSVTASGTVVGSTSLSVLPVTATFNTAADGFPTEPMADKKIVITYTSNYNPWKIMAYTNNTQVENYDAVTKTGRYAKGGLATADGKSVVPCKWVAKAGSNTVVPSVPAWNTYNFVKDKRDEDDPSTVDNPATPDVVENNESWAAAMTAGYPNLAYGDTAGGFCVDPTIPVTFKGDAVSGSVAVYIAAMFGTSGMETPVPAGAGTYSSPIYFDLYHE